MIHYMYIQARHSYDHHRTQVGKMSFTKEPVIVAAAYITAIEATATDLLGWVPLAYRCVGQYLPPASQASSIPLDNIDGKYTCIFFCGNFGILLINSSWINIDGGKKALDMLEKMVNITMMRGAQSGGAVTFEPAHYGSNIDSDVPILKGVRSRVVNAKRTDLSKGVRRKLEADNNTWSGNLRGWDKDEFNSNSSGKRLVRGFFGHTRFATSSMATMDGTHPHQWSKRKSHRVYAFQSPSASHLAPKPQLMGVENFITHNGDFEFYKVNGEYHDTEAIQDWLTRTLHEPMPCTVDSAAIAGMIDLLKCQGCFALSARYALCFSRSLSFNFG